VRSVVETSRYVAPYVQVFSAYRSPRWVGSSKHVVYAKNINSLAVLRNFEGLRSLESLCWLKVVHLYRNTSEIHL